MWDFEDDLSQTVLETPEIDQNTELKEPVQSVSSSSEKVLKRTSFSQAIDWESSDDERNFNDEISLSQKYNIKRIESSAYSSPQEKCPSSKRSSKRLVFDKTSLCSSKNTSIKRKHNFSRLDEFEASPLTESVPCSQNIDQISSDAEDDDIRSLDQSLDDYVVEKQKHSFMSQNVAQGLSPLRGSEWLKNIEAHGSGVKCISRESTQLSIHSESPSESGLSNVDEACQDNKMLELWDSSKKKKVKRGGLAEKMEEMIKNESSDRALKEHFREKDSVMDSTFATDLVPLKGEVLEIEIGIDDLMRLRCKKDNASNGGKPYSNISQIFEVILNKDEISGKDRTCDIKSIQLQRPFVEVQLNDYHPNRKDETLTVITNPCIVKISA